MSASWQEKEEGASIEKLCFALLPVRMGWVVHCLSFPALPLLLPSGEGPSGRMVKGCKLSPSQGMGTSTSAPVFAGGSQRPR